MKLQDYEELALQSLARINKNLIGNQSSVDTVMEYLINADQKHDATRTKLSTYRYKATDLAVKKIYNDSSRRKEVTCANFNAASKEKEPIDYLIEEEDEIILDKKIETILLHDALTKRQREVMIAHFVEGKPVLEIAKSNGVTKQSVYMLLAQGISNLQEAING